MSHRHTHYDSTCDICGAQVRSTAGCAGILWLLVIVALILFAGAAR